MTGYLCLAKARASAPPGDFRRGCVLARGGLALGGRALHGFLREQHGVVDAPADVRAFSITAGALL